MYVCICTFIPCTQYSPLVTEALHSVDTCCLILLHEVALSDLVVPIGNDNLWEIHSLLHHSNH